MAKKANIKKDKNERLKIVQRKFIYEVKRPCKDNKPIR